MTDTTYRDFVERVSLASPLSDIILNRSPEHAAVVIEFLFKRANRQVNILTRGLSEDVYCNQGILAAAEDFLRRNDDARIAILSESKLDRSVHPLLNALDSAGFKSKVDVYFVPKEIQGTYSFNFAVADGSHYRLEENRNSRAAVVRFGDLELAQLLDRKFSGLLESSAKIFDGRQTS